jgi:hypothetical protein
MCPQTSHADSFKESVTSLVGRERCSLQILSTATACRLTSDYCSRRVRLLLRNCINPTVHTVHYCSVRKTNYIHVPERGDLYVHAFFVYSSNAPAPFQIADTVCDPLSAKILCDLLGILVVSNHITIIKESSHKAKISKDAVRFVKSLSALRYGFYQPPDPALGHPARPSVYFCWCISGWPGYQPPSTKLCLSGKSMITAEISHKNSASP